MPSLEPTEPVHIDYVRHRGKRFAAGEVIVAREALQSMRVSPELHPRRALTCPKRLLAGAARGGTVAAPARKSHIDKQVALRVLRESHSSLAQRAGIDVRTSPLITNNARSRPAFRRHRKCGCRGADITRSGSLQPAPTE
jgi:hypothetical protein